MVLSRAARTALDRAVYPADTLGMTPDEMRRLGHKVVDLVVDRLMAKQDEPAILTGEPEELLRALGGHLPEEPLDPDHSVDLLVGVALRHQQHGDHPRYFARVPGPSSFAGVLGEWLGTGFDAIASSWGGGSGPATVELVAVDWLRQIIGLPERTEGVLVSGGSLANLTAFAVARSELGFGVAYYTDQTHSSLPRDLREMGWPADHIRKLESDGELRMPIDGLSAAIAEDRAAGRRPLLVIATAGSTNTGTADPLDEIAAICGREGMWFHVDGAYGGPAAATEEGRAYLAGLARADRWSSTRTNGSSSLTTWAPAWSPGAGALERCFAMSPEYLKDVHATVGAVNFGNRSLELTRRSRALKLWFSMRTYGAKRFREAVQRGIDLAKFAEAELRRQPDRWEVVTPATIGIVCFSLRHWREGLHRSLSLRRAPCSARSHRSSAHASSGSAATSSGVTAVGSPAAASLR